MKSFAIIAGLALCCVTQSCVDPGPKGPEDYEIISKVKVFLPKIDSKMASWGEKRKTLSSYFALDDVTLLRKDVMSFKIEPQKKYIHARCNITARVTQAYGYRSALAHLLIPFIGRQSGGGVGESKEFVVTFIFGFIEEQNEWIIINYH